MTQHSNDTTMNAVMEIINDNGLDGLGNAVSILINEAMKIERSSVLKAQPWERNAAYEKVSQEKTPLLLQKNDFFLLTVSYS